MVPLKHETAYECAKEVKKAYYRDLGEEPLMSRHAPVVQSRMALSNALDSRIPYYVIGELLGVDRTTALHYRRTHENNLEHWEGYRDKYITACSITAVMFEKLEKSKSLDRMHDINMKLNELHKCIQALEKEKESIKIKFNV